MDIGEKPVFVKRERMLIDSKVEVKYPEKTWSVEQSYRDIYQNHLDAQFKLCVNSLLLDLSQVANADPDEILENKEMRKVAYEYLATKSMVGKDIQNQMIVFLMQGIGAKSEEETNLRNIIEEHNLQTPDVEVLVRSDAGDTVWLKKDEISRDELQNSRIVGFRISDDGTGYDANLKAMFYSSGKDSPDQIGKFGEGGKMSEILLQQKGFRVESRSAYDFDDESGRHHILWKSRPRKSEEGSMELQVTKVELDKSIPTGSVTEVIFRDGEVKQDDVRNLTECIKSLGPIQILYDVHRANNLTFVYPYYEPSKPLLGVSKYYDGLMVQGIRVEPVNTKEKILLGYSTFDKDALIARDRNKYSDEFLHSVEDFWLNADPSTIRLFFDKLEQLRGKQDVFRSFEVETFNKILRHYSGDELNASEEKVQAFMKNVLQEVLRRSKVNDYQRIYFKSGSERYDFAFFLDHDVKVVDTAEWGIHFDRNFLESYLGDRYVSPNELRKKVSRKDISKDVGQLTEQEAKDAQDWYENVLNFVNSSAGSNEENNPFGGYYMSPKFVNDGPAFAVVSNRDDDLLEDLWEIHVDRTLQINWKAIKDSDNRKYLERELAVYIFAYKYSGFGEFHFYSAQNMANDLIRRNWQDAVDYKSIGIDYKVKTGEFIKIFEGLRSVEIAENVAAFNIVQKLTTSVVETVDVYDACELLNTFKRLDTRLLDILTKNIFRTKDGFARYTVNEQGEYVVNNFGFDEMEQVGDVDGMKAYKFGDYVFLEVPRFDYIKHKNEIVYRHENTLYRSSPSNIISWEVEVENEVKFGEGFCYFKVYKSTEDIRSQVANVTSQFVLVDKRSQVPKATKLKDGYVATSVSLEYGKGNWDKPIRFFEDIVQNHLNAGEVSIKYMLTRDGSTIWVEKEDMQVGEKILGVEFSDNGRGYAPESLERMGRTEKSSPLDEGKYGEGTKMLLAAACRNQIDLEFSSNCQRDGVQMTWRAHAEQGSRQIVENGKVAEVKMAGFALGTSDVVNTGSTTRIVFNDTTSEFYVECLKVLDPMGGDGGLSRYVRTLPGGVPISSSVGPVKVLADSKGDIYENGLLMSTEKMLLGSFDVPDVSATRERDTVKAESMKQYVDFVLSHTTDRALVAKILKGAVEGGLYGYLDTKNLFDGKKVTPINLGIWQTAALNSFSDVIIDDISLPDSASRYLRYNGYNKRIHVHGRDGKDLLMKECFPTVKGLIERSRTLPTEIPQNTREKVNEVVDILADEVLKIVDSGGLGDVKNQEFVAVLRDKQRLHSTIEYSKIHPFILGEAKGDDFRTVISEYLLHDTNDLNMVLLHEWAHHLTEHGDLDVKFIAGLLGIAWGNGNKVKRNKVKY
ncbi:MAG: hypothetical protein HYV90_03475 [Candidatus Woesebacteria bacterium]|nr:MAG: hypothetical protein HYV90_03475 [Candidatus Woesebacteria bacterium]